MSNQPALDLACDYLARGLSVLPIEYRGKRPFHNGRLLTGWQRLRLTADELPAYFNGQPQNIGVLLGEASGELVDVDLDCPIAVKLAPAFLPPTGAIFGRDTKRRSHWLYHVRLATKKFRDPLLERPANGAERDKAMLVELRSTGAQTVFPGSVHESGEAISWDSDGDVARVEAKDLESAAARLAAATLLARHWPPVGSRQDAALALAGGLLRAEWSEDETAHFIEGLCDAAGDEETRSRIQTASYTLRKLTAGTQATGWPTLAKIVDKRIVDRVCEWLRFQEVVSKPRADSTNGDAKQADDSPLRIVRMSDVQPETVRWLWRPYIPLGKLTLLEGDPGVGKSTLTCAITSAVSNGRGFPGAEAFEPGGVLILSAEDGLADTLRPRLDMVGADTSRVFALDEPLTLDLPGLIRLEAAIIEHGPVLVIIDPLFAYTGGKTDIHRANECRAISAPLAAIAERHSCAIMAVRHLGKSRGGGHALNAGIGSIDFVAAARSVLLAGQDPDDATKRAVVQSKNNLAPIGEAVGFTLERGQFFWTGASTLTAGRILALPSDEEERGTLAEARDFLRAVLSNGTRDSNELKSEARQAGISERTLFRAKKALKVKAEKVGLPRSEGQKWVWKMPAEDCQPSAEE
jgi:hypothetical protein